MSATHPTIQGRPPAVRDVSHGTAQFRADVLRGLAAMVRTIPCKYFYDERGAQLFDAITQLEEYYLTATETSILARHADEMAECLGRRCLLVELGSGSAVKTPLLVEALEDPVGYVPIDLAREQLAVVARDMAARFPGLEVLPVCADYTRFVELPVPERDPERVAVFFPGSTIGNFEPPYATRFLAAAAAACGPGGALLIGVDRQKDVSILERAYNDGAGLTAEFNLNVLRRMRRELGADVDPDRFEHRAVYNARAGRIEMHLVSRCDQTISVPRPTGGEAVFRFAEGDVIVTEYSYKYTIPGFTAIAHAAGLDVGAVWSDERDWFSIFYLEVPR